MSKGNDVPANGRHTRPRRRYSPAEAVADRLRDRILSGEVPNGGMLPKLEDLTEEFRVSKASLREACRILETEGLLSVLRGNVGGFDSDTIAAFFLNGEKMLNVIYRGGGATVSTSARKEWRLPDAYQLPLVIILNDRVGSGPEVLAADLKENKRATIVGGKSIGCMGATSVTNMTDGSKLAVVTQEFVGAQTGTIYNNVGVVPDVAADDVSAVDKAIEILKQKM